MLTHLWFAFFAVSFISACYQWLINGQSEIFSALIQSTFEMASLSVEISIGLIGVLALWLGFFKIAERAGMIQFLSRLLEPLFLKLMPDVPKNHPAHGSITMNIAANILGLDNAATPMGLKAMQDLQTLNPEKDSASNAQILFLVLNTSAVTLLPVTIFMYRAQQGSTDPTAVFLPILMATSASTLTGLLAVAYVQKINLFDKTIALYFSGFAILLATLASFLVSLPAEQMAKTSSLLGNFILFSIIMLFLSAGWFKKIDVYDAFIEGAKQGFEIAIKLIPYLLAMLIAIGLLRSSGVLDGLLSFFEMLFTGLGVNTDFIQALPTAFMKPLSGSGARAMMLETMNTYGVDSFAATVSAIMQGSTETTFYVLAVYFGSVGIKKVRHALACALLADFSGIATAVFAGYLFFH
ncbi:Gate supefamily SpmA/SpmB domains protein [hydrothermal vent metagenome]|uniref:Gate supefamily SpmA/SpmB domains protein n=1 Tax=hydrothermal vent metagenome TaxID=652676 RepID=A0A3B0WC07_9ZZZZ